MSENLWATIQGRKTLEDFPCCFVADPQDHCHDACDGFDDCEIGAAYRDYMRLRAVVEAMFVGEGGMRTPQRVIEGLCGWRDEALEDSAEWHYYDDLAEKVGAIA